MRIEFGNSCIRSLEPRDEEALVQNANDEEVVVHLRDHFPHPYTRVDARRWIEHARTSFPETQFAIACGNELVGGIGLTRQEDVHRRCAELGYWLGRRFWGQGIATRAVCALTEHAFETTDLHRIFACVFDGNPASARVLEKAGYVLEGRLRGSVYKRGRLLDQFVYARLREPPRSEPVPLEVGPRTFLRHPTLADTDEFLAMARDSRSLHHPWVRLPTDEAGFRDYLHLVDLPDNVGFLVLTRDEGSIAGVITICEIVRGCFRNGYVGFCASRSHAGQGYLTEGLDLVLRHAFGSLRLHRLEANIQPQNRRSIALVQRCGFAREGYSRRYLKIGGRWKDHERWAILAELWRSIR